MQWIYVLQSLLSISLYLVTLSSPSSTAKLWLQCHTLAYITVTAYQTFHEHHHQWLHFQSFTLQSLLSPPDCAQLSNQPTDYTMVMLPLVPSEDWSHHHLCIYICLYSNLPSLALSYWKIYNILDFPTRERHPYLVDRFRERCFISAVTPTRDVWAWLDFGPLPTQSHNKYMLMI